MAETEIEPEILTDPARVVDECYRLISFEAGAEPQWERFRQLFSPRAALALRVFPDDPAISVMSMDEYVVRQMRDGMKERGYSETILERRVSRFADIAEAHVDFEMRFGGDQPVKALDIFQLVRRQGRWWIVSIISDMDR